MKSSSPTSTKGRIRNSVKQRESKLAERQAQQGATGNPSLKTREALETLVEGWCFIYTSTWFDPMLSITRLAPASEYEGTGGPEDKVKLESERRPGDQDTLNIQDLKTKGLSR